MKIYFELLKILIRKCKGQKNGKIIKEFCENMGIVYIKLAQILATQNYGELFTEEDRLLLSSICDNSKPIPFEGIKDIIEKEYNSSIGDIFLQIDPIPIGSASISQVHKAILKNGEVVAIKVKRKDITNNIEADINRIKKLMYRYGKFVKFGNFSGGDKALELYLKWILEETDFVHEKQNIKRYSAFAESVNGKVEGNKSIKVPKIYESLCTDNIIVMEYIPYKTINQLELNEKNCEKIRIALNSYISSSLYAMFNNLPIVFHGDPHNGNIYIDEYGNIGFLDMGLLFELTEEDAKLTKEFFFAAYTRNYEKMYNLVVSYGNMDSNKRIQFKNDIKDYCDNLSNKPITSYFINMMNICLKYEVCPPNFLFCMAKAFMCLGGINTFSQNDMTGTELLKQQVIEYYIRRSLSDSQNLAIKSIKVAPKLLESTCKYGLVRGISKVVVENETLYEETRQALEHYREMLNLILQMKDNGKRINYNETKKDTSRKGQKLL